MGGLWTWASYIEMRSVFWAWMRLGEDSMEVVSSAESRLRLWGDVFQVGRRWFG